MAYILMVGYLLNGFRAIGPFEDHRDAVTYATDHLQRSTWELIPLETPSQEEE